MLISWVQPSGSGTAAQSRPGSIVVATLAKDFD
jgi:hypothetical protein